MNTNSTRRSPTRFWVLALLIVALPMSSSWAGSITLQNQSDSPVVVYASAVIGGRLVRERPHLLAPGATTPTIDLSGNVLIKITDARRPNYVLFHGAIPARSGETRYSIVTNKKPRLKLVRGR